MKAKKTTKKIATKAATKATVKAVKTKGNEENKPKGVKKSRNFLITLNNPQKFGFTQESLYEICAGLEPLYFCMSEEVGKKSKLHHCHIFIRFANPRSRNTIKEAIPPCHIDICKGDAKENIDYVFKEGKYLGDEKGETNLRDTHVEWGNRPEEAKKEAATAVIKKLVDEGLDVADIIDLHPNFALRTKQIEAYMQVRMDKLYKKFKDDNRENLQVVYIFGKPGTGKSYYVRNKHKYNICVATDYKQPFEEYNYQNVMVFEEFRSDIHYKQMLQYLDIYPCSLPHRYGNRFACYTKAYVISNLAFDKQYEDMQRNEPESWPAFTRRFKYIMEFCKDGTKKVYNGYEDYKQNKFQTLEEFEGEKHEQIKLV